MEKSRILFVRQKISIDWTRDDVVRNFGDFDEVDNDTLGSTCFYIDSIEGYKLAFRFNSEGKMYHLDWTDRETNRKLV